MRIRSLLMLAVSTLAFAGKPQADLPVTTYLSDYNSANAAYYVQSDDGTEYLAMHMENQCSEDNNDMYTMKPGQTFACSTLFRLPNITSTSFYRLDKDLALVLLQLLPSHLDHLVALHPTLKEEAVR